MKKSEKIEIRVSLDEKQKLSDIAEGEGRTVSELVRALIERYMALNKPMGRRAPWAKFAGIAVGGLLLGHLATWGLMRGQDSRAAGFADQRNAEFWIYQLNVIATNILTDGRLASNALKMPIVARHGNTETFIMERQGDDLQIDTFVTVKDDALSWIDVTICRLKKEAVSDAPKSQSHDHGNCDYIASQRLLMGQGADASVELATEDSDLIALGLQKTGNSVLLKPVTEP